MKSRLCATLVLMLLATGCATKALRSEFDDVPVPRGMTYQQERSVVIESPTVKAGELVYRGRLEPESLGVAMRTLLESNGWRHVNTTTSAKDGARQVYEKGGNALQVRVYEGLWFTYLAIGVSRTLQQAASQTQPQQAATQTQQAASQTEAATSLTNPTMAGADASVSAPNPPEPRSEPSFAQRVRDFFSNLFPR
jgi:hypothetical protein